MIYFFKNNGLLDIYISYLHLLKAKCLHTSTIISYNNLIHSLIWFFKKKLLIINDIQKFDQSFVKTIFYLLKNAWTFYYNIWVEDLSHKKCEAIYRNLPIY